MNHIAPIARNTALQKHVLVRENGLHRVVNILSHGHPSLRREVAATATATASTISTASENRSAAIDGRSGHGAGVQAVVQSVHFICKALRNESVLSSLRSLHGRHVELVLEADVLTLRLGKLTLHAVQLQSAQLVKDRLSATGLSVDDIAGVLRGSGAVGAVFGRNGIFQVRGRGSVVAANYVIV